MGGGGQMGGVNRWGTEGKVDGIDSRGDRKYKLCPSSLP